MFLIPIIFALTIATGIAIVAKQPHSSIPQTKISGAPLPDLSPIELLAQACNAGLEIPQPLVIAALAEAAELGDEETFRAIVSAFPPPIALQKQSEPETQTVVGKTSPPTSPIRGIESTQWSEFVSRLRTQEPSYKDERHVGAFYHNVKRLSELGIDPATLTDESSQYQALTTDIIAVNDQCRKLINEWCGDTIDINGTSTPITHSGMLGLLKAAGTEGTKAWLTSKESRVRYPNTTKQFLNTNGLF